MLTRVDSEATGTRDFHKGQVGISITQTMFDGFQTLNNVRAAESNVLSSCESLKAKEVQILHRLRNLTRTSPATTRSFRSAVRT